MKKKVILSVLGGAVAGLAAIPIVQGINYSLGDWISKRIRKEIDQYEDDKEFEAEMKEYEEYEKEQESLFDENLDDEFDFDFISSDDILSEPYNKKFTASDKDTISREMVEDAFITAQKTITFEKMYTSGSVPSGAVITKVEVRGTKSAGSGTVYWYVKHNASGYTASKFFANPATFNDFNGLTADSSWTVWIEGDAWSTVRNGSIKVYYR